MFKMAKKNKLMDQVLLRKEKNQNKNFNSKGEKYILVIRIQGIHLKLDHKEKQDQFIYIMLLHMM